MPAKPTSDKLRAKQAAGMPSKPPGKAPRQRKQPAEAKFRLPHGTRVEATYDASKQMWFVRMTIGPDYFTVERRGIHHAITELGQLWHESQRHSGASGLDSRSTQSS